MSTISCSYILDLLSKECFDSFWLFLALRRNGESVCAVTVSWPLRHACQIQMVSAAPLCLSWANKHIHKNLKSPFVTTANYVTHNTMVSQASNKLKIMGRKKNKAVVQLKSTAVKISRITVRFKEIKPKNGSVFHELLESASWGKTADDFSSGLKNNCIGFILGVESWNEVTIGVLTSQLLNGTKSSLNVW